MEKSSAALSSVGSGDKEGSDSNTSNRPLRTAMVPKKVAQLGGSKHAVLPSESILLPVSDDVSAL